MLDELGAADIHEEIAASLHHEDASRISLRILDGRNE